MFRVDGCLESSTVPFVNNNEFVHETPGVWNGDGNGDDGDDGNWEGLSLEQFMF